MNMYIGSPGVFAAVPEALVPRACGASLTTTMWRLWRPTSKRDPSFGTRRVQDQRGRGKRREALVTQVRRHRPPLQERLPLHSVRRVQGQQAGVSAAHL